MPLLWIDLETTGLNFDQDIPIEVGLILTTFDLTEISRRNWICRVKDYDYEPRNLFVHDMHSRNGLLQELFDTEPWSSYSRLDEIMENWLHFELFHLPKYNSEEPIHPAGSSVYFDVRFVERRFPSLFRRLHYRYLDVSSIKMLALIEGHEYDKGPEDIHRALSDLDNDIDWLKKFMSLGRVIREQNERFATAYVETSKNLERR